MADLTAIMPIAMGAGVLFFNILGIAALFKAFYKKVAPGEVLILSTMEPNPRIIRNGALVFPIIYKASKVVLKSQVVEIERDLIRKIKEKYSIDINNITVQVIDSDNTIIQAHTRIDFSDDNQIVKQFKSIVDQATQEAIVSESDYEAFKTKVSTALNKIGCELVV